MHVLHEANFTQDLFLTNMLKAKLVKLWLVLTPKTVLKNKPEAILVTYASD